MTLDASVMCTCFREGRVKPPPIPIELIVFDEDGWPDLSVPYSGNEALYAAYDDWRRTCCPHADMELASEFLGNCGTWGSFTEALAWLGAHHVPTLLAEFPEQNGGSMSASSSARALRELAVFRERLAMPELRIVDAETGEEVVGRDVGIFWQGQDFEVGFDARGLFVRTGPEPKREVFRALHIEQRVISDQSVVFVNRETKVEFPLPAHWGPLNGIETEKVPQYLELAPTVITAAKFVRTLPALERLFQASVESGNPVRWG